MHRAPYASRSRGGGRTHEGDRSSRPGYATRLRPLTDTWAKELLPVGGTADHRPRSSTSIAERRRGRRGARRHERAQGAGVRRVGAGPRRHRPRRRHDVQRGPARRDRRHAVRDRARRDRRRPARDRRRQPVRVRPRRSSSRSGAAKGTASAVAVRDVGSLELARRYGIVDARRRRPRRSTSSRSRRTRRRRSPRPRRTSSTARTCRSSARISTTGNPPDQPGRLRRLAAPARARLRLGVRRAAGTTSATTSSCSRRTTAFASRAGPARRARPTRPTRVTHSAQRRDRHVDAVARSVESRGSSTSSCRPAASPVVGLRRTLCSGCRALAAPAAAAALRAAAARRRPGRSSAAASARASAGVRLRALGRRVRRACAALVRAWKERGLRRLAACAAELVVEHVERPAVDVITYIPPDPIRQLGRGRHPAESLARELAGRWELELVSAARARGVQPSGRRRCRTRERGVNVRGAFAAAARARRAGAARRRRLHDGLDRERGRVRAAAARRLGGRGGDVRAGDPPLTAWLGTPRGAAVEIAVGAGGLR